MTTLMARFEAASKAYAESNGIHRDRDWFILKLQEEMGEVTQAWNRLSGRGRRRDRSEAELQQDLADEAADMLGHVLLLAHHHNLDLASAIQRKWRFDPLSADDRAQGGST